MNASTVLNFGKKQRQPKITYRIKVSSSDKTLFSSFEDQLRQLKKSFNVVYLPTQRKRFTVLRSPHVNNKAKEHFQISTYSRLFFVTFYSRQGLTTLLSSIPSHATFIFKKLN